MLEIVQFTNGRYGLRNTWTGIVLPHEFRTIKGAQKKRSKLSKRLTKTFASLNKN